LYSNTWLTLHAGNTTIEVGQSPKTELDIARVDIQVCHMDRIALSQSQYLPIQEAARFLKVSEKTLRRWEEKNVLVPIRTPGGHRRYTALQLQDFKKARKTKVLPIITTETYETPVPTPVFTQTSPLLYTEPPAATERKSFTLPKVPTLPSFKLPSFSTSLSDILALGAFSFSLLVVVLLTRMVPNTVARQFIADKSASFAPARFIAAVSGKKAKSEGKLTAQVLGTDNQYIQFTLNVDTLFNEEVTIKKDASISGSLAVNSGNITTTAAAANLFTQNATTIAFGTSGTAITIGATTGTTTINNATTEIIGVLSLAGNRITSAADLTIDPGGGGVSIGTGTANSADLAAGDLFVSDDLEVDGTIFAPSATITGVATIGTVSVNSDSITDFTGTGLTVSGGSLQATLGTSISTAELEDGSVTTAKIADSAVTTAKVNDSAITNAKISDEAINEAKLLVSNAATDGYSLTYNSSTGGFTWTAFPAAINYFTDAGPNVYITDLTDDFTIGTATDVARLGVVGDSDEIQTLIQANATQTSNIFVVEQSTGTDIFSIGNTGATTLTNSGGSDIAFNLSSTGDFVIQDGGVAFATFTDSGTVVIDSLTLDGTSIASSGNLTLTPASNFVVSTLDCTANTNGGALTANASGVISCSNDDGGGGASDWTSAGGVVFLQTASNSVNIGGAANLAKLGIDGDSDEIQFLVQGNATQTNFLGVFEQSTGTDVFTIANNGDLVTAGDIAVNGGDVTTTATTVNLFDTNATTINFGGAADNLNIGFSGGAVTITSDVTITGTLTTAASDFAADGAVTLSPSGTNDITMNLDADSTLILNGLQPGSAAAALCLNGSNDVITCDPAITITLQDAYDNDPDGTDVLTTLSATDDSLIYRNPGVGGTESGYIVLFDQANTGGVDAIQIANAGTGDSLQVTNSSTGILLNMSASGVGTTTDGIIIANSSSGAITDALDVSDAEIVNALNVGPNAIIGSTAQITFDNFQLTAGGAITAATAETINGVDISAGTVSDVVNLTINSGGDLTIGAIGLNDIGTNEDDSGASLVGTFDEFTNSSSTNVQDVLHDLDAAIGAGTSKWTDGGAITYLTAIADDFAVGASNTLAAPFSVDVSANLARFGTGATANAQLDLYASDADTGSLVYNTSDQFNFTGGDVLISQALTVSGVISQAYTPAGTLATANGIALTPVLGIDAADQTLSGINIAANTNSNSDSGDVYYGVNVDNITATGSLQYAFRVGAGYDGIAELEGTTANAFETFLTLDEPTVDNTITFPNASGTVILSGHTFTSDVTATLGTGGTTALTIAANSVALTTDTTGNYVANVTGSNGITITGTPGEGWTPNAEIAASAAGSGLTFAAGVFDVGAGNGISVAADSVAVALTSSGTAGTTSSSSGMEFVTGQLTLLKGCADNELLTWDDTLNVWKCNSVAGVGAGGDITAVGSMTTGAAFADSAADDDWLGLGASAGRIEFDDQATDEVNILSANVGIGTATPATNLHVSGTTGITVGEDIGSGTPNTPGLLTLISDGDNAFSTIFQTATQTENVTYTLPPDDGTSDYVLVTNGSGVLSWESVTGVGAGTGDITSVTASTGLTGGGPSGDVTLAFDFTDTLTGDSTLAANEATFGVSGLIFEGATANTIETYIAVTDPTTSDKTITIPDASGTVILSGHTFTSDVTATLGAGGTTALTIAANSVALGTDTTGNYVADVTGSNGITITGTPGEGWTANAEIAASAAGNGLTFTTGVFDVGVGTGLAVTANAVAFDFSNALSGSLALAANEATFGQSGIIFEGATADTIETYFAVTDPTSTDKTITVPDASGTIILSGHTFTSDVTATLGAGGTTALTIAANSVALTTDTTGNYVQSVTNGVGITGGDGGSEGAALTLAVDQSTAFTWTADHTFSQATPSLLLVDTTGASDDYSINVEANAFSIVDDTDARTEISFAGNGSIDLGDNTATKTIDIGGVTASAADTINIATNATAADIITIGNSDASTTLALTGGDDWNITAAGAATFDSTLTTTGAVSFTPGGTDDITFNLTAANRFLLEGLEAETPTTGLCLNSSNQVISCSNAGSTTLQTAYNNDDDGTADAIIALTGTDDSLIFRNPAVSGTDSTYILTLDQLADAAKGALNITQAGTGAGVAMTFSNVGTTTDGLIINNSAGTLTDAIDVSDATGFTNAINVGANRILGTTANLTFDNFQVVGSTGNITTAGDLAVNGDDITSDGNLTLAATGYVRIGDTGTPGTASGDDDLYVEGDLEVDATALFDSSVTVTGTLTANGTLDANGQADIGDGNDSITLSGTAVAITANAGNDITLTSADDLIINPGDDITTTFVSGGQSVWDASTSDNTTTNGVLRLVTDSSTSGNIGFNNVYTAIDDDAADTLYANRTDVTIQDDTTASDTVYGQYIGLTQNDTTPATVYGLGVIAEDAGTSVVGTGILVENLQATDIDMTDAILVRATTADSIVDALDVSDAEITNALNVGANIITGTAYTISNTGAGNDITFDSIDQLVFTDFTNGGAGCSALETNASGSLVCGTDDGATSAFTAAGGIIDKTTAADRLRLLYGDAGDVQFEIQNTTNSVVPTADAMQINLSGGSGIITDNVDGVYVNIEGADGTSTDLSALHLDFDPVTGSSDDTFTALLIDAITGTAAVENAITVGSGWDSNLLFNDTTTQIQIADTGVFTFEDSAGNDLATLTDNANAGDLALTGDLTVTGGDIVGAATTNLLNAATTVNLGSTAVTRTINLGTGTNADTINIGTGGTTADDINIGGLATSTIDLTGATNINASVNAATNINTGTSTGTVTIGGGSNALVTNSTTLDMDATGAIQINSSGGTIGIGNDAVAQNINLGTGAAARTITVGNATGATALNLTSGTGPQTFTSSVVSGTTTTSAFAFIDNALTTGTQAYMSSTSITTGKLLQLSSAANTLTTGTLLDVSTTSTAVTGSSTGLLGYYNWDPASTTTGTGDLFRINIGSFGNIGNLFNVTDGGSSLFAISESAITSAVPHNFTAAGDLSVAYDLQFTNQTLSSIRSYGPLVMEAGETFENNNLTLRAYNSGNILAELGTTGNFGVNTVDPLLKFHAADSQSATASAIIENTNTGTDADGLIVKLGFTGSGNANNRFLTFMNGIGTIHGKIRSAGTTVSYDANGVDFAEYFTKSDSETFEPGDLVAMSDDSAKKSAVAYDPSMIGIVSASPGFTGGVEGPDKVLTGLVGQVPLKIAADSQAIKKGDPITSSSTAGHGMKATQAGHVIGLALEDWTPGSGTEKVLTYINPTYYEPLLAFNNTGDVAVSQVVDGQQTSYQVNDLNGVIKRVVAFSEAVIANLRVGKLSSQEIATSNLTIGGKTVQQIVSEAVNSATAGATLATNVVTKDIDGNATIAGTLSAKDATISGTLYAERISGLDGITDLLGNQGASLSAMLSAWDNWNASASAMLSADAIFANEYLNVQGTASITDAMVNHALVVGGSLAFDHNSISLLSETEDTLYIQPTSVGKIDFLAGNMTISADGGLYVGTDAVFAKNLTVKEDLITSSLKSDGEVLGVQLASESGRLSVTNGAATEVASIDASGSATFSKLALSNTATSSGTVDLKASAGTATLPASQTELIIYTNQVTADSLIYITPNSSTENKVLYVKSKVARDTNDPESVGSFTVGVDSSISSEVKLNWWIIN
jgi:hypothetical protein